MDECSGTGPHCLASKYMYVIGIEVKVMSWRNVIELESTLKDFSLSAKMTWIPVSILSLSYMFRYTCILLKYSTNGKGIKFLVVL